MSTDNVLVVTFGENQADDTNAYQALTDLKQLDAQHQIEIAGAAVISRDLDGRVEVKSEVGNDPYLGTASGGMIGLLVGIIGGPLGVLLGGAYGALVGSLFDIDDVETTESVLAEISKQVHPTRTALLAQVVEQTPEVVDSAMARLGARSCAGRPPRSSRRSPRPRTRSATPTARPARNCTRPACRRPSRRRTPRSRS
jgi:uncharacterized membrane protein